MPKKYIDSRGWKYQVMSGIGDNFKARYQRPEKHGDVGWKGLAAVPWRGSREEAQAEKGGGWWCCFAQDCAVPLLAGMYADREDCRTVFSDDLLY